MKKVSRVLIVLLTLMVFVAVTSGCSYLDNLGLDSNITKYGETKTISKSNLSKSIKSKWGSFKFSSKQIKKIKKLKKTTTFKKFSYTTKKTISGKTIYMYITKISKSKYQVIMATVKF